MKVKNIIIVVELEEKDIQDHATMLEFQDGCWQVNGKTYPRINAMMQNVWDLIKRAVIV